MAPVLKLYINVEISLSGRLLMLFRARGQRQPEAAAQGNERNCDHRILPKADGEETDKRI